MSRKYRIILKKRSAPSDFSKTQKDRESEVPKTYTEREAILRAVADAIGPPGPLDSFSTDNIIQEREDWKRDWIDRVPPEWAEIVLDALDSGVDWFKYGEVHDYMPLEMAELLGLWAEKQPQFIIPLIGKHLNLGRRREILLRALTDSKRPEVVTWVTPLVDQTDGMSDADIAALAECIGVRAGVAGVPLLQKLKATVPAELTWAHEEIDVYLHRWRHQS